MFRKIKLYGELAKITGHKELDAVVTTTAQAVSFLVNNFPQLEGHMSDKHYQVLVGEENVSIDQLNFPIGKSEIKFVPVVSGSGGLGRALLGGALIAVSMGAFGAFGAGAISFGAGGGGFAAASLGAKAAFGIGASLVLSGVSGMLFPVPKMPEFSSEQDPRLSFSFGGTQQTSRAGTPVPLVYGEIFTGSVVISSSTDTEQVQV
jgi:predicted phage tail protein